MTSKTLDTTGLKCPQPVLKITAKMRELTAGDVLEVKADCETFEEDIRKWCKRMNKILISLINNRGVCVAQIRF